MSPEVRKATLQIHLCVALWGFTAILGKLISLPALPLVWWRMVLVVAALALLPACWRGLRAIPPRQRWVYAGIGALVALHWLTFYGAIKLSNASIGATCMALATVFTAIVEPWLAKRPFSRRELALGMAVLPGVALVAGGVAPDMRMGIVVGAVSALFVGLFGSLNKRFAGHHDPLAVTALELGAGIALLTVLAPIMPLLFPAFAGPLLVLPSAPDALWLALLAGACTLLPFALSLVALFGSLNKRLVEHADPLTVTAVELGAGTLALTALAPLMPLLFPAFAGSLLALPSASDALWLLLLAGACTLFPFALSLVALRHMSAFSAQMAINLEPVYAIMLAMLLLAEQRELAPMFYAGVAIILAAVFAHPLLHPQQRIDHPEVLGTSEAKGIVE